MRSPDADVTTSFAASRPARGITDTLAPPTALRSRSTDSNRIPLVQATSA